MRTFIIAGALALGLAALPVTAAEAGSTWRVTAKASRHQVVVGKKLVISGHVRPGSAAAGTQLVVQEKFKPGVKWKSTKIKAKVVKSGAYKAILKPTKAFTHQYRIVMPATPQHSKGVSPTVKVAVYGWSPLTTHAGVNGNNMGAASVNINGKTYENSVRQFGSSGSIEYNVNHVCIQVQATFGISDDSTTGGQGEVSIATEASSVYSHTFDLGQSQKKTIKLDPAPLKLRLEAHSTSTTPGVTGFGAFGSIQVLCTQ